MSDLPVLDVPVLLLVAAASGAGKTTLLERLIPALAARGVRAAAVKLTHHEVDLDPPGKDSRRLRDAGAAAVVLGAPRVTSVFVPEQRDVRALARLAASAADIADVVLVEGGREDPVLPRIELVPRGGMPMSPVGTLVALVCDDAVIAEAPVFRRDEVDRLADHVGAWLA
jgi:molybdopterin-guanine dinucleotide biosynthesis protein B